MDTKDPVWDDDDSMQDDGFRPRQPMQESSAAPSPRQQDTSEESGVSEAPHVSSEPEHEPKPLPPPPLPRSSDRIRVEPVDSIRRPMAGAGRAAQDRRERSSTSMVIIAVLLFLISVISITVYFFSRPAEPAVVEAKSSDQALGSGAQNQNEDPVVADTAPENNPPAIASVPDALPPAPSNSWSPSTSRSGAGTSASPSNASQRLGPQSTVAKESSGKAQPSAAEEQQRQEAAPQKAQVSPKASTSPSLRTTAPNNGAASAQWVVQVHSSPSVDDADEWLQQLQTRNVADGRIEPVTQQGRIWYRVRFGRFATRQEAEQAALQLGYRNAWIDRVR